jgi:cobalamin synthase
MTETIRKFKKDIKMSPRSAKDLRHYVGAAGIFLLIVFLLLFLSYNEIPPVNKDVFVSVVGMMVGSLSVVIYTIIGKNPEELEGSMDMMEIRNDQLESMIIQIQQNIIKNLTPLDDISTCECGNEKCNCKNK